MVVVEELVCTVVGNALGLGVGGRFGGGVSVSGGGGGVSVHSGRQRIRVRVGGRFGLRRGTDLVHLPHW